MLNATWRTMRTSEINHLPCCAEDGFASLAVSQGDIDPVDPIDHRRGHRPSTASPQRPSSSVRVPTSLVVQFSQGVTPKYSPK